MKEILNLPGIDGHYPQINYSADLVVCGSSIVSCYSLNGNLIFQDKGRVPGWLNNDEFLYLQDIDDNNARLMKYNVSTNKKEQIIEDTKLTAFNTFKVSKGNWVGWRAQTNTLVYNGNIIGLGYSGCDVNGNFVVSVRGNTFHVFKDGVLTKILKRPDKSNNFNVGELGPIYYGYFWETKKIDHDGDISDLTVTPWQRESPIKDCHGLLLWLWSYTETPKGKHWVLGRPLGDSGTSIIIENTPASYFDVKYNSGEFYIASSSSTGHLKVVRVREDHPRQLVKEEDIIIPKPPEPKPPPPVIIPNPNPTPLPSPNTFDLPHITDKEFSDVSEALDRIYRDDLHREPIQTYVDPLGRGRWMTDYLVARSKRNSHEVSIRLVEQAIRKVAGLNNLDPNIDLPKDLRFWYGNFLAFPNFPEAFMYPGWPKEIQKNFRHAYRAAGFTHLPIGIYGDRVNNPYIFDYSTNVVGYKELLLELQEAGIVPCVFVVTDAVNSQTNITPNNIDTFCDRYLPFLNGAAPLVCLGWELNQVKGWTRGRDWISLSQAIRRNLPKSFIYYHLQPNWWGPGDIDEYDWLKDAKEINGILYQIRPESSLDIRETPENEKSPDGLYIALKYKGAKPNAPGICGRVNELGKDFVMFEHSRHPNRWEQVRDIVLKDSRVKGLC